MSAIDAGAAESPLATKPFWRPAVVVMSVVSMLVLLALALYLLQGGYVRKDIVALQAGDAWRTGGWLSQLVLRVVSLIPARDGMQLVLSLIAAGAAGLSFGALYERLRANSWLPVGAVLVLLGLALNAGELYTLTASSRAIPLYIAFAALIPAIAAMEEVGDVQSAIGLGLLLPLLLLASPITTPLILPLAIGAALANPDGRRDPRAFVAMLLVALLPTLIVGVSILGFLAQSGHDLADALLPYVAAYSGLGWGDLGGNLIALAVLAPILAVPLLYCVWPGTAGRRHVISALAVVLLALYLVLCRTMLNTTMTAIIPALGALAAFVSWLAVVRLPLSLRIFGLVMLAATALMSWTQTGLWDDPQWKAALFHALSTMPGNFSG